MPTTCPLPPTPSLRRHLPRGAIALAATLALGSLPALAAPAKARAAAGGQVLAECSWDRPGHNKFSGDVPTAIDRYTDIPADVRSRLQKRMTARDYDDMVSIKRDRIAGKHDYDAEIRDMYFGAGSICRTVTRSGWNAQMHERGMVYCDSGHCILVPTVCRNVSRITRREAPAVAAAPSSEGELPFDPPGAGLVAAPANPDAAPAGAAGGAPSGETFASQSGSRVAASPWFAGPGFTGPGPSGGASWPLQGDGAETGGDRQSPMIGRPYAPPLPPRDTAFPGPTAPVPEPQTWAMFAAGLALLGGFTRLRRRGVHWPTAR